jgi:uncharacterized membrane protein YfcA
VADLPTLQIVALLLVAGAVGGFLNTAASSGSAVTLPSLIALGMHPMLANTTNRVPVLIGFAVAIWKFHRAGEMPWREGARFTLVMVAGAVIGAVAAAAIDDYNTSLVVTAAVIMALAVLCVNPARWLHADHTRLPREAGPFVMFLMFLVGIWTGLVVLDSGTYTLAVLVLAAHYSIRQANAIKALAIGTAVAVSLLIFGWHGQVEWAWAIPLSIGSILGSLAGVRVALAPHAAKWVFRLLVAVLAFEIIRMMASFL